MSVGALFTITGADFSANGIPLVLATIPTPLSVFGSALDLWLDFGSGATVSGGVLTALTDRSSNASVLTGSIPYTTGAFGSFPGISNDYGAGATIGTIKTAANVKSLYDYNKPFSFSMTFIYGGATSFGRLVSAFDNITADGCGWELLAGGFAGAFGADRLSLQMKPLSASGADGNYAWVYSTTALVIGTLYRIHVTIDGSGTAEGVSMTINNVPETLHVFNAGGPFGDNHLTSTWVNTSSPQYLGIFDNTGGANGALGTLLELFTVTGVYTTPQLTAVEAYLDSKYTV